MSNALICVALILFHCLTYWLIEARSGGRRQVAAEVLTGVHAWDHPRAARTLDLYFCLESDCSLEPSSRNRRLRICIVHSGYAPSRWWRLQTASSTLPSATDKLRLRQGSGANILSIEAGPSIQGGVEGKPWTAEEIELVVRAYFYMLRMQESGQAFNKSECNRVIGARLPARSTFSISRKHSNISAVLSLLGVQTLRGYKPLYNFQKALAAHVEEQLRHDLAFDAVARQRVQASVEAPILMDYLSLLVPIPQGVARDSSAFADFAERRGLQRDYLAREALNRSIGLAGEYIILEFEKAFLIAAGTPELAARVEHVSKTRGDGLGYDILSYCPDGTPRHIEVKTTSYGAHTPMFISVNEVAQSELSPETYWVYRVFELRSAPKFFMIKGSIPKSFVLEAASYRANLR